MRVSVISLTFASLLSLHSLSPAYAGTSPGIESPPINPDTSEPSDTGPSADVPDTGANESEGGSAEDVGEGSSDGDGDDGEQQFRDKSVHVIDAVFECTYETQPGPHYVLTNAGNETVPAGSKIIFSRSDGSKWYFTAQNDIEPGTYGWVWVDPQFPSDFDCADIVAHSPGGA